ncbi:immunity repressor [Gordonia phage Pytheas]|nr:hypothetical protein SEA_JABLANSKI_45 [Gordonia Phage Jablanski]UYL88073.1 immunity repressor [Gordonia phage Pytheas]
MTTLRQLIQDRMSIPGHEMSLDEVVEKAQKAGEKLGRSNLHKLTKEDPLSLTRATIYGLAAGLGVTPLTVANAAIESMGITTRPVEVTDTLTTAAIDPTLSEQDRKYLSTLIREMRNANSTALSRTPQPRAPREASKGKKTDAQVAAEFGAIVDRLRDVSRAASTDATDELAELLPAVSDSLTRVVDAMWSGAITPAQLDLLGADGDPVEARLFRLLRNAVAHGQDVPDFITTPAGARLDLKFVHSGKRRAVVVIARGPFSAGDLEIARSRQSSDDVLRISHEDASGSASSTSNASEEVGDLPAAARRGRGKTKGELLRDRDAQIGEESQVAPDEEV